MAIRAAQFAAVLAVAAGLVCPMATAENAALAFLEQRVADDPLDSVAQAHLAFEYVNAMRSSGDLVYLRRAEKAARASLQAVAAPRNPEGVSALAVALYESHRFKEALGLAQQALSIDPGSQIAALLIGDAQFEMGSYAAAEQTYARLAKGRTADLVVSRAARLAEVRGKTDEAIALLMTLTNTPEESLRLRVRLQLAELCFARGDFVQTRRHLKAAQRLQPESHAVQEHWAELQAAEGRFAEAEALYRKVIARVPRPEYMHALGELYQRMQQPEQSREWLQRAKGAYLESARQGNAHYYHHLASFFSDADAQPEQALYWAREDLKIRTSIYAYDGLAWALYKNGEYQTAAEAMDHALATGTRSAHVLFRASMVYSNAGRIALGRELMQEALSINPRYNTFHVHR